MKRLFFLFQITLFLSANIHAQDSDLQLIEKTLHYYLDGGTNNDFETLKKAFHPTATMKFSGEEYKEVNAIEFFQNAIKPGPKSDRKTRIVSISQTGTAANALLEIAFSDATLFDYMNLLKINGEWKIVSKIFSKK